MKQDFGLKQGMRKKGPFAPPFIVPPIVLITFGFILFAWGFSDYQDMKDAGLYEQWFMDQQLRYFIIYSVILWAVGGVTLAIFLTMLINYWSGRWSIYGFSFDEENLTLTVNRFAKRHPFKLADIESVTANGFTMNCEDTKLDKYTVGEMDYGYGHMSIIVNENGVKKKYKTIEKVASPHYHQRLIIGMALKAKTMNYFN